MSLQAIPTRYAGCHFRSRLEARWAVFFESLCVPWIYESQGFSWKAKSTEDGELCGGSYLPDFWLPSIKTYFEVKGEPPNDDQRDLYREFSIVSHYRHITAWGGIPRGIVGPHTPEYIWDDAGDFELNGGSDTDYMWCACWNCGKIGIEYAGRGGRICRHDDYDKHYWFDVDAILDGFDAARSARFEFGENGAT